MTDQYKLLSGTVALSINKLLTAHCELGAAALRSSAVGCNALEGAVLPPRYPNNIQVALCDECLVELAHTCHGNHIRRCVRQVLSV